MAKGFENIKPKKSNYLENNLEDGIIETPVLEKEEEREFENKDPNLSVSIFERLELLPELIVELLIKSARKFVPNWVWFSIIGVIAVWLFSLTYFIFS